MIGECILHLYFSFLVDALAFDVNALSADGLAVM